MTATNNLEQSGTLSDHPFAELCVEIAQVRFTGSLRVEREKQKAVFYFRDGEVVYAATNSKSLRLFNLLLRKNRIDTKTISRFRNFANDVEFGTWLIAEGIVDRNIVEETTLEQINATLVETLTWEEGDWTFSPLVRVRDEMTYPIDLRQLLVNYARCVSKDHIFATFWDLEENFALNQASESAPPLQKHEEFVLSKFGERSVAIDEIRARCTIPDAGLLQALYVLWLGGFIARRDWNFAFSATRVGEILTARVSKIRDADEVKVETEKTVPETHESLPPETSSQPETIKLPEISLTLDEYLSQVESAENLYDVLGVPTDADLALIRHVYFSCAKRFHPDRFHREESEKLKRIHAAFTQVAHAHETLRTVESRAAYDDKIRKELEIRQKRKAAGQSETMTVLDRQAEQGLESFEEGLALLNEGEHVEAAKFLARAVHYSPQNALFHAYLGKALSGAGDQYRHKAEAALNTGVRLDPKNASIRMMLVQFLVNQKMLKRAEGELKRFLELVPNNKEAMAMLAKLKK